MLQVTAANIRNDHWAAESISRAMEAGWLSGNVEPESNFTLERFIMLQNASGITPASSFSQTLRSESRVTNPFTDTGGTELETSGYLQMALDFGILLPSDFLEKKLHPSRNTNRSDAILLTTRVFGGVYSARKSEYDSKRFSDFTAAPECLYGYINESAKNGVLYGYPDSSVRAQKTITLAEAVALIDRTVLLCEKGIDTDIKLKATNASPQHPSANDKTESVTLHVHAQVIDGIIYVPAKSVYFSALELYSHA